MIGTRVFTSRGFQLIDIQNTWSIVLLWMLGGVFAWTSLTVGFMLTLIVMGFSHVPLQENAIDLPLFQKIVKAPHMK